MRSRCSQQSCGRSSSRANISPEEMAAFEAEREVESSPPASRAGREELWLARWLDGCRRLDCRSSGAAARAGERDVSPWPACWRLRRSQRHRASRWPNRASAPTCCPASSAISPACPNDETAGAGAILQLVGALHHVDLFQPDRLAILFRQHRPDQRRLQRGRELVEPASTPCKTVLPRFAALAMLPRLSRTCRAGHDALICLTARARWLPDVTSSSRCQPLLFAEVLKGIAWASILAMPYAILATQPAASEARHLHGPVQCVHRGAPAAGGNRYGERHEGLLPRRPDLDDAVRSRCLDARSARHAASARAGRSAGEHHA